jgi:hypothetical protein
MTAEGKRMKDEGGGRKGTPFRLLQMAQIVGNGPVFSSFTLHPSSFCRKSLNPRTGCVAIP